MTSSEWMPDTNRPNHITDKEHTKPTPRHWLNVACNRLRPETKVREEEKKDFSEFWTTKIKHSPIVPKLLLRSLKLLPLNFLRPLFTEIFFPLPGQRPKCYKLTWFAGLLDWTGLVSLLTGILVRIWSPTHEPLPTLHVWFEIVSVRFFQARRLSLSIISIFPYKEMGIR